MGVKPDRRLIWLTGAVSMALLVALAVMPALQAGACSDQYPYDYGDANMDEAVDIVDVIRILNIVVGKLPPVSASDANADGVTTIADGARALNIVVGLQTALPCYINVSDFAQGGAGGVNLGAHKQAGGVPGDRWVSSGESGWTNFSSGDYADTAAIDANDLSMSAGSGVYNAVQARFWVPDENVSLATHLEVELTGKTGAGQATDIDFYAWNANSLSWTLVDSVAMTGDTEGNFSAVSSWGVASMGNYIDANDYIFIMAIQNTAGVALEVDYLRLVVVTPVSCPCPPPLPTPSATPTATASAMPDTTLRGGEWWLWQVYYNSEEGEENTVYHIASVRSVDATVQVTYDAVGEGDSKEITEAIPPERGFTNYSMTGAAIIDWSVDQSGTKQEPVRERVVITGLSGSMIPAKWFETLLDREIYVKGNDPTCWIDANSLSRRFGTTVGMDDGDIPKDILYSYQDDSIPANSSAPPGAQDGYPFAVGEDDWRQWEWIFKDQRYLYHPDTVHERGFRWHVSNSIDDYDVGANCEAPAAVGAYDVILLSVTNNYFRTYDRDCCGSNLSADVDTTNIWWNDSVKHFVRKLDLITYVGREDWGIVAYETRNLSATINEFSDSGSGFDINVTITNNEVKAGNFSVLALVMDMDAVTNDEWSDGAPYPGGETVYPDMSSWASISEAIQHTGTLAYGESATLTWNNVGTSGTNTYKLWCNGGTAIAATPTPTPSPTATPSPSPTPTPTPTCTVMVNEWEYFLEETGFQWHGENPASVYCLELGYNLSIEEGPLGQSGICTFPDNTSCEEWSLITGQCGQNWSFCEQQGGGITTVYSSPLHPCHLNNPCGYCILGCEE